MNIQELIEELNKLDPELEVHVPSEVAFEGHTALDEIYESSATFGILCKGGPTTIKCVVLDYSCRGL